MSGNFLGPHLGTRVKTMHEQELEAAVAAERERILDRLRNPDEGLVDELCDHLWGDASAAYEDMPWREKLTHVLRALADTLNEKEC